MRKISKIIAALSFSISSMLMAERCYEVSASQENWSRTKEFVCLTKGPRFSELQEDGVFLPRDSYELSMYTSVVGSPLSTKVASQTLLLKSRARCFDCNKDELESGVAQNSIFSDVFSSVTFDGKRSPDDFEEGTIKLNGKNLFYRSYTRD